MADPNDDEIKRLQDASDTLNAKLEQERVARELREVKDWQGTFLATDGVTNKGNRVYKDPHEGSEADQPGGSDSPSGGTRVFRIMYGGTIRLFRFNGEFTS